MGRCALRSWNVWFPAKCFVSEIMARLGCHPGPDVIAALLRPFCHASVRWLELVAISADLVILDRPTLTFPNLLESDHARFCPRMLGGPASRPDPSCSVSPGGDGG